MFNDKEKSMDFKRKDAVFCPSLTTKQLLVDTEEGVNGMTLEV